MCISVAFTAGCTFDTVEQAQVAASAKLASAPISTDCVSVLFTAGCSFGDARAAAAAADAVLQRNNVTGVKLGCGSVLFTAACSL